MKDESKGPKDAKEPVNDAEAHGDAEGATASESEPSDSEPSDSEASESEASESEPNEVSAGEDQSEPAREPTARSKSESKPKSSRGGKPRRGSSKAVARDVKPSRASKAEAKRANAGFSGGLLIAAVALALGATGGWFARDARAKTVHSAGSDPAAVGSAGPCATWEQKLCEGAGAQSAACSQAKSAAGLLTTPVCDAALTDLPATLAKVKAERKVCDTLVTKLCAEFGKESSTCSMVQQRTASIPPEGCKEMLENYDKVVAQLKQLEQRMGGARMGGPRMGGPRMGSPVHGRPAPGAPAGATPKSSPPPPSHP